MAQTRTDKDTQIQHPHATAPPNCCSTKMQDEDMQSHSARSSSYIPHAATMLHETRQNTASLRLKLPANIQVEASSVVQKVRRQGSPEVAPSGDLCHTMTVSQCAILVCLAREDTLELEPRNRVVDPRTFDGFVDALVILGGDGDRRRAGAQKRLPVTFVREEIRIGAWPPVSESSMGDMAVRLAIATVPSTNEKTSWELAASPRRTSRLASPDNKACGSWADCIQTVPITRLYTAVYLVAAAMHCGVCTFLYAQDHFEDWMCHVG
ncbi:hypothetical protein M409DRAFT_58956 [Zasmidium cellare ATCC 36951]|uniref:Uncharacterized protein n=1 Tax=Zasmidium cellare ATCC 36951 TaxID=1080233 RepID=A0A6A6C5M5_ZASCE|nr:uncharacterized protein M409DRAFT_58956 [Zasmidium cellare ATCC 36951]KAF2161558.1 hypothetical protein M409DRAFT_58956 [Zasmidium cellare ATCC 36951]